MEFEKEDIQREPVVREVLDIYSIETVPEYTANSDDSSIIETSSDD